MHRSIVALDLEGSTMRTNPVKGELRRTMYDLLRRALEAAGIADHHLEELTDRGDGILLLIRPHDDVPKTVLLGRLIPLLTALLIEYNAEAAHPALRIRLRTVVHAGEVHVDDKGFYGEAIDVAIRLLDSAPVKRALKQVASPLVLVVSEEIHSGIVSHGYVDGGSYRPLVRVRIASKQHRGWVHVPEPVGLASTAGPETGYPGLLNAVMSSQSSPRV
jgi:class 3 adenylate cyclase